MFPTPDAHAKTESVSETSSNAGVVSLHVSLRHAPLPLLPLQLPALLAPHAHFLMIAVLENEPQGGPPMQHALLWSGHGLSGGRLRGQKCRSSGCPRQTKHMLAGPSTRACPRRTTNILAGPSTRACSSLLL
jgi:hypothetical protein